MKTWLSKFWGKHGERLFFLSLAVGMAAAFWFMPEMRESAKVILIGAAMLCYNKARSGEEKTVTKVPEYIKSREEILKEQNGFVNPKILLFFVAIGMMFFTACAGFQDKSLSEKATQVLTSTKIVVVAVAEASDEMCTQGVLTQNQCDEIGTIYAQTATAYDLAADLLVTAVKLDSPEAWDGYQNALNSFLLVYSNFTSVATQYNIYKGETDE